MKSHLIYLSIIFLLLLISGRSLYIISYKLEVEEWCKDLINTYEYYLEEYKHG